MASPPLKEELEQEVKAVFQEVQDSQRLGPKAGVYAVEAVLNCR